MNILFIFQDVGVNASTWDMYDTYKIVKDIEIQGDYYSNLFTPTTLRLCVYNNLNILP